MASTLSRTDLWLRHIPAVRGTCASCRSRRWSPRLSTGILASRPLGRITGVAGSSHVLEKLKDHGYALGIVTNCSTNLGRQAVQKCDRPYSSSSSSSPPSSSSIFDGVITAEEVGFYKPHPNTYLAILSALGVQPDEPSLSRVAAEMFLEQRQWECKWYGTIALDCQLCLDLRRWSKRSGWMLR